MPKTPERQVLPIGISGIDPDLYDERDSTQKKEESDLVLRLDSQQRMQTNVISVPVFLSFYGAPDMHFISLHASVLQHLPAFFLLLCIQGDKENIQK